MSTRGWEGKFEEAVRGVYSVWTLLQLRLLSGVFRIMVVECGLLNNRSAPW